MCRLSRNTMTLNEWLCCFVTAGCVNKQPSSPFKHKRWWYVDVAFTSCWRCPQVTDSVSYCRCKDYCIYSKHTLSQQLSTLWYEVGLENVLISYCSCDMRIYIVLDFVFSDISIVIAWYLDKLLPQCVLRFLSRIQSRCPLQLHPLVNIWSFLTSSKKTRWQQLYCQTSWLRNDRLRHLRVMWRWVY